MQILLINHYAGSLRHGMEYRPFYLGREWVRLGHEVTIAAASCSHVRTAKPAVDGDVSEEDIEGVRYLWFKTPEYHGNGPRRAINMLAFTRQLARHQAMLASRCAGGAAIASSTYPLDIFPARRIARRAGAKLVFEVHDLWPLSPMELGGMSRFHPFIMLLQRAENFAYRHADAVVSMLPNAEPHMRSHGLAPGKFSYIPNGIDVTEWAGDNSEIPREHQQIMEGIRQKGHSIVMYAGSHGVANALDSFVRAAELLRDQRVTFLLVGQGPEKAALERLVHESGLTNVRFLPPVPKRSIPAILRSADLLFLGLQRCSLFRFGISPNKLMDYMMAGKPIIQAIDAGNDMVVESGCGTSVSPETPNEIAAAVLRLLSLSDTERIEMGSRGSSYVSSKHAYPVLAQQFLHTLGVDELCRAKK